MHQSRYTTTRHASGRAIARSFEGFDGQTHYRSVVVAASSAMAILLAAATVLVATF